MNRFSSLRVRLIGVVLLAVAPAVALLVYSDLGSLWLEFCIGMFALGAAWIGGELFVLRQVKTIQVAATGLARGDLGSRTGLLNEPTELGDLARALDSMAENLEREIQERERTEQALLNRAHQQTVVAALGQFALVTSDLSSLLNQAILLTTQTLEVQYIHVLEFLPNGCELMMRAGEGWKEERAGGAKIRVEPGSQMEFATTSGEPLVIADLTKETRFQPAQFLLDHGVVSGASVIIPGHNKPYGILGAYTTAPRKFTEEEVYFLLSVATLLAMAVERRRTEPEIEKLAAFAKFNPNPVLEFSSDGTVSYFNEATEKLTALLGRAHPEDILPANTHRIVQTCLATGQRRMGLETRLGGRILMWSFHPVMASQAVHCYVEDTTERAGLEEQLRQSQKMESVGQLAAGVAHDFNNILTIIQGHSGLLMSRPNLSPAMTTSIQAVSFAAERAASLTRQLLMFSRKQVMQPKSLDLRETVGQMSKMLQRMIGETITLHCEATARLPSINGDAGMMEQILMNLAINARDAMTTGGELYIRTDMVSVDEAAASHHAEARPGNFVRLRVTDTGSGIDPAVIPRIFEPFFTTKEAGKGTGLGLATVYGIVKQHSGWIEVTSQVGEGTTFAIYLPVDGKLTAAGGEAAIEDPPLRGDGETILVVEDEPELCELALAILQDSGYRVVSAKSGVEALTVWQGNQGNIDLLLTDMIMPEGLSGKDLAESLLGHKPGLKIIFTSGYNVEDLSGTPGWKNDSHFLQKPYSRLSLAKAVRECLDS